MNNIKQSIQDISEAAGILKARKHYALAERLIRIAEEMLADQIIVNGPNAIRMNKERREALDSAGKYRMLLDAVRTERDELRNERDALLLEIKEMTKKLYFLTNEQILNAVPGIEDCFADPYDAAKNGDPHSSIQIDMLRFARAIEALVKK